MLCCCCSSSVAVGLVGWVGCLAGGRVVDGDGVERIMAMTGFGVAVKVLKRDIRSRVAASWVGERSEGVTRRKS